MKWLVITIIITAFAFGASAQQPPLQCPTGSVCFTQAQANTIFDKLNELVAAKDLIIKLQTQAGTADTALANALKVIEGHVELQKVNDQIILKKDQIIVLYERVMQIQMQIIENLEKRLMKPRSPWGKFLDVLKTVTVFLAGAALGGI